VLLRRFVEAGNILACCAINVTEIYAGVRPQEDFPMPEAALHALPE
jgi:hypothetical protein